MKTLKLIPLGALLALCATTATAQTAIPLSSDPGNNDPGGSFAVAKGLWLHSSVQGDERKVLIGHSSDGQGNKIMTWHLTMALDRTLGSAVSSGPVYGEVRLADVGHLNNNIAAYFGTDPEEQAVLARGRWIMESADEGTFEAVLFVRAKDLATDVPVGIVRGSFSDKPTGGPNPLSTDKGVLSGANPFDLEASGEPVKIVCPANTYSRLIDPGSDPLKPANPFSTPERTVEAGIFTAKWLSYQ